MLYPIQTTLMFGLALLTCLALSLWVLPSRPLYWSVMVYAWMVYRLGRACVAWIERSEWLCTPDYHIEFKADGSDGLVLGYGFPWDRGQVAKISSYEAKRGQLPPTKQKRGGVGALQAVGGSSLLTLPDSVLSSHVALEGATQSGKTTLLANLATQLIRQGAGAVMVIDPKGSNLLLETLQREAAAVGRPFRRFCPYLPENSCKYNPLSSCSEATEIDARLRPLFPDSKGASYWTTQPLSVAHRVAQMHKALGHYPFELPRIFADTTDRDRLRHLLCRYLALKQKDPFKRSSLSNPLELAEIRAAMDAGKIRGEIPRKTLKDLSEEDSRFDEINGNFGVALSGVVDSDMVRLIRGKHLLSWEEIDDQKMIVLVQTHSLSTRTTGYKIGQLVMQDFQGHIGARYAHPGRSRAPITLIVDEIAEMIYPDFRQSISKIGEGGGRMILGWQSQADLDSAIGLREAKVVRANIRTRVYLRIDDDETAAEISRHSGTCKIRMQQSQTSSHNYASGANGSSQARVQVADVEVPLLAPNWLQKLPQGEAFARIDGSLYKFSVPVEKGLIHDTVHSVLSDP